MKVQKIILVIGLLSIVLAGFIFLIIQSKKENPDFSLESEIGLPRLPRHNESLDFIIREKITKRNLSEDSLQKYGEPVFFSITNLGEEKISPQLVVNGRDWSSNESVLKDALQNTDVANREATAKSLWQFVVDNRYHFKPAVRVDNNYLDVENPLQYFNSWGYGYCDDSATVLAQLATLSNFDARIVFLTEHVVAEIFYNDKWHMLDPDREVFYTNKNGEIASIGDIFNDKNLIKQTTEIFNRPEWVYNKQLEAFSGYRTEYVYPETFYPENLPQDFKYTLREGEEIRFYYQWPNKHYWSLYQEAPPVYTNGILITPLPGESYLRGLQFKDEIIFFQLPYPILGSYLYGENLCKDGVKVGLSFNNEEWKLIDGPCQDNVLNLSSVIPLGEESRPTRQYFLKIPRGVNNGLVITQFQVAPKSIPRLKPGQNDFFLKNPENGPVKIRFGFVK